MKRYQDRLAISLLSSGALLLLLACADGPASLADDAVAMDINLLRESCYDPDDNHCVNEPLDTDPDPAQPVGII
jgi:hypothetical protein